MPRHQVKPAYGEGRQALIEAAIRLVAREGLYKLTYRSLAAEAGVTHGVLQHHFESMNEVLDSALEYHMNQSYNYMKRISSVEDFIDVLARRMRDDPERLIFQVELSVAARLRPTLASLVKRQEDSYRKLLGELLKDMQVSYDDSLVEYISMTVDGIVFQRVVFGVTQPDMMDRQLESLGRVLAKYVTASA